MLKQFKQLLGTKLLNLIRPIYHGFKAYLAAIYFGFPGRRLKLIGITGTKGKTTTTVFCGRLLNLAGVKTGYISTAVLNVGEGEFLNEYKMTSLDSWILQKYLQEMVKNGCQVAVLEMSSQGLEQNRHLGLGGFDIAVFLNLYPEHLEAHGGWENYRRAKGILFQNLKPGGYFVGNADDPETLFMWSQVKLKDNDKKVLFSSKEYTILSSKDSLTKEVQIQNRSFKTQLLSEADISNAIVALKVASLLSGQSWLELANFLKDLTTVRGRMDFVCKHQSVGKFTSLSILVDYAHEPESMKQLLETLNHWKREGFFEVIIHVVSADGVGRDDWKKPILGELSFKKADFSVLTTDNYDEHDNPHQILDLLAERLLKKEENKKFFKIINRRLAMRKALQIGLQFADKKVLIVSTGVGSEASLTQPHGSIPWDEKLVWQELVQEITVDNM